MSTYDHRGNEVYAEQELSREELAEYRRQRHALGTRSYGRRRDPERDPSTYSWEPTEADREAGRES